MDRKRLDEICLGYLWDEPLVILLVLDRSGIVVDANRHAIDVLPEGLRGRSFTDLPIDFHTKPSLAVMPADPHVYHQLNLSTANRLPQTYLFRCFDEGDRLVLVGKPDIQGLLQDQGSILSLHRDLANQVRELNQTRAQLDQLD